MSSLRPHDSMSKDKRRKGKEREVAASPVSSSASPMSRRPTNTASSSSLRAGKSSRLAAPSGQSKQPHRSQTEKHSSASIQHVEPTRRYSESEPDDEGPPRRTPDDLRKRLLTLLINDPRYQDPQLEEIWVNMRKAPGIDGMWVEALDVTKLLQNAPGRIEGPAKVYAKRQSYRQIFMTVSVDGSYACKPTNLHVPDGRSLQLWVDDWKSDPELLKSRISPRYHPYSRQDDGQSREDRRTASPASQVRRTSRSDAGQSIKYSHREESAASRSPSPERMSVVTTTVSSRSMTESLPPSVPSVPSSPAHRLSSFLTTHFDIPVVRGPSIDLLRRIKRRSSSPLPSASADVIDLTAMDSDHEPPKVKQEPDFEPLPQQDWMQESSPQPEAEPEPEPVFRQPPQMSQSTSGPSSQSTVQPMSQPSSQPTPSPAPQQPSQPEARPSPLRQASQPAASETPRDRVLSGGFGAFGSSSTVVPSGDASRRSSGFASFSNRNPSGGFGSFASTPSDSGLRTFTSSPTPGAFGTISTTPPSLGFGAFAQSPASFRTIIAEPAQAVKPRKAFLGLSEPATLHDKMVEYVRSLLEEDPGWDAFLGARRQLLPMVHYIQHLRWQKSAVERLNGKPFPAELGAEQGATITKDLIMSAFHAQASYEATLDRILELYALYGPGAPQEDPQAVSVLNERPMSTPMHQVKKCLLVLEEVHARLEGGS